MAERPAPTAKRLWLALFLGCILSGLFLLLVQFFFLPLVLIGTGGIAIAIAIAAWVVFKGQQGLLHAFTRWRPPLAVVALTALPGLAVGYLAIRVGLGLVSGAAPGCATQALALRVVAAMDGVGAAPWAMPEAPCAPVPAIAAPPPPAAMPTPEPAWPDLVPDTTNPAAGQIASSGG